MLGTAAAGSGSTTRGAPSRAASHKALVERHAAVTAARNEGRSAFASGDGCGARGCSGNPQPGQQAARQLEYAADLLHHERPLLCLSESLAVGDWDATLASSVETESSANAAVAAALPRVPLEVLNAATAQPPPPTEPPPPSLPPSPAHSDDDDAPPPPPAMPPSEPTAAPRAPTRRPGTRWSAPGGVMAAAATGALGVSSSQPPAAQSPPGTAQAPRTQLMAPARPQPAQTKAPQPRSLRLRGPARARCRPGCGPRRSRRKPSEPRLGRGVVLGGRPGAAYLGGTTAVVHGARGRARG